MGLQRAAAIGERLDVVRLDCEGLVVAGQRLFEPLEVSRALPRLVNASA